MAANVFKRVSAGLERATTEADEGKRAALMTFVLVGGGFKGAETMAAINDFCEGASVRSRAEEL